MTEQVDREARGPRKRKFPTHLRGTTPEGWRQIKRQEWRELMAALERFNYGCAYVPAQAELWQLQKLAKQIETQLRARGWVAW